MFNILKICVIWHNGIMSVLPIHIDRIGRFWCLCIFQKYFLDFNFRTSMCCLAWSLGLFLPMHIDRIASYMVSITKLFWTCIHTHTVINNYFGLVFSMGYFLVLVFGFWCFSCWYFSIFLVGIFDIFLVGILVFVGSCRLQNGKQSVAFATNLCNALLPFVTCFG